jgi:hypothetical protein
MESFGAFILHPTEVVFNIQISLDCNLGRNFFQFPSQEEGTDNSTDNSTVNFIYVFPDSETIEKEKYYKISWFGKYYQVLQSFTFFTVQQNIMLIPLLLSISINRMFFRVFYPKTLFTCISLTKHAI